MNFENLHRHRENNHVTTTTDDDADTSADHYFDDPSLHFPLSPTSVRKEIVSLAPSISARCSGRYLTFSTNIKKTFRSGIRNEVMHLEKSIQCPALSPCSEGTQSTADWMQEEEGSHCGSLTYSIETDRCLEDDFPDDHIVMPVTASSVYDDDDEFMESEEDQPPKCFQLLDIVVTAIRRVFQNPEPQPLQRHQDLNASVGPHSIRQLVH
jgi:hypothetical protein